MKNKTFIIIIVIATFLAWVIYEFMHAFGPEYSNAEIKQNIGGVLICNTVYNADIHSWVFDVNYKYKGKNGKVFEIGNGTYCGREWLKDEQLIRVKNWVVLKTGGWLKTDKVIIGDSAFRHFIEYEFTPDSIEKDPIWIAADIHSLLNYTPSETSVDKINNGQIEVVYKFRTSEINWDYQGQRKIVYMIDPETGVPKMRRIKSD